MKDVERLLAELGPAFDREIERVIPRHSIPNLHDAVWYHLSGGGKRLRPALAVLACRSLGGDPRKVMPFAAACELLHNWFLVHDDIEDGDVVRRGRPAVWTAYGLAHGINVGDFMSEKVYELVLGCHEAGLDAAATLRLAREVAQTCSVTAEGQAMDITMRQDDAPTEESYLETVRRKTGWYFTLPIVGGALVAGASEETVQTIRSFGLKAGPAFQIADDLLDLTAGKGRDDVGADIREGKRSMMVVHCSRACAPDERRRLFEILNKPRDRTTREDVVWVKGLFERCGSLAYAEKAAKALVAEAKQTSASLPPALRDILNGFADYLIERKH